MWVPWVSLPVIFPIVSPFLSYCPVVSCWSVCLTAWVCLVSSWSLREDIGITRGFTFTTTTSDNPNERRVSAQDLNCRCDHSLAVSVKCIQMWCILSIKRERYHRQTMRQARPVLRVKRIESKRQSKEEKTGVTEIFDWKVTSCCSKPWHKRSQSLSLYIMVIDQDVSSSDVAFKSALSRSFAREDNNTYYCLSPPLLRQWLWHLMCHLLSCVSTDHETMILHKERKRRAILCLSKGIVFSPESDPSLPVNLLLRQMPFSSSASLDRMQMSHQLLLLCSLSLLFSHPLILLEKKSVSSSKLSSSLLWRSEMCCLFQNTSCQETGYFSLASRNTLILRSRPQIEMNPWDVGNDDDVENRTTLGKGK